MMMIVFDCSLVLALKNQSDVSVAAGSPLLMSLPWLNPSWSDLPSGHDWIIGVKCPNVTNKLTQPHCN